MERSGADALVVGVDSPIPEQVRIGHTTAPETAALRRGHEGGGTPFC